MNWIKNPYELCIKSIIHKVFFSLRRFFMISENISEIISILNLIMMKSFYISLITLITLQIVFLVLWSIGIFIKSEKLIKLGIKLSITFLLLIVIIIVTIILISKLKVRG